MSRSLKMKTRRKKKMRKKKMREPSARRRLLTLSQSNMNRTLTKLVTMPSVKPALMQPYLLVILPIHAAVKLLLAGWKLEYVKCLMHRLRLQLLMSD